MISNEKNVDFLVIGGGVAGLRAAIELASVGNVLVLTKDKSTESSTGYAQGGIAVAMSDEDKVSIHYDDTIKAGSGLCREDAVKVLVEQGPDLIRELISWGANFDKDGSKLSFTMEAAHSRKRVLHSHGDSTGKEIERVLINRAKSDPSIRRYDFSFTLDLIINDNRCIGATVLRGDRITNIYAKAVVLATGGAGQVFARTTNPFIATGDGIAIAYRAGAVITDMEFIQFHPTTLYSPAAPPFLLSEAMRGEGAVLKNIRGERFMPGYHDMAELASRDQVSRAILSEMVKTDAMHVYLDLTALDKDFVKNRFPLIYATCLQYDIDITEDLIPVSPAVHYIMGGVQTNLDGETNIQGLFAAGEVACTGVHGANRLASNSLLEGLVYGARSAKKALGYYMVDVPHNTDFQMSPNLTDRAALSVDSEKIRRTLRQLMWGRAGIIRCAESLGIAKKWLDKKSFIMDMPALSRRECELKNMLTVASLITDSALLRKGSVGAHYRSDFKERGDNWQSHTICQKGNDVVWRKTKHGALQ
ncbi:MAG: L-aspartate oxidase [Nitrospiraceae bacterium]|nr:MAG: L-aspartate oxidase [Nitrospiraceae bacterium]